MKHADNHAKVYVNKHGQRVMRVSQVIRRLAKEQLIIWANMLGLKGLSYKKTLEEAANIGSLCHAIIENYVNPNRLSVIDYDEFGITDYMDQASATRAIRSFTKWYSGMKDRYKVLHTELVVVGESLGGTIDCVIEDWKDPDKVILVDYKTSSGMQLSYFLQLSAYAMLYDEVFGKGHIGGIMVVRLDKKNGHRAEAKLLRGKNMNLCKYMFKQLFEVAMCEETLNANFKELLETVY